MSTTVTYKGSTLTTATNQTKVLKTAGKYMEDDVTITDSSSGGGMTVVETQDPAGGTIVTITGTAVTLQTKSNISPTESSQTIEPDTGYTGLSSVQINAIPSDYVGSSITSRSSSDLTASGATITAPAGYYENAATKSVASGSATGPSSLSASSATVSTGTNTLTLTKTDVSTTPTVSAGYVSSATASTATVALTASVTIKGATTYNTSSSDQTIASGTYLTGTQTIKAVTVSGLSSSTILSGTTVKIGDANDDDRIASVSGSVTFATYYTGSSTPSSSLGVNGDIYLQTSS